MNRAPGPRKMPPHIMRSEATKGREVPAGAAIRALPLLLLLASACGGGAGEPAGDAGPGAELPQVSIEDVEEEHITSPVAVVNGVEIYRATYEQVLNFLRDQIDAGGAANVERYLKAKDDALERAIDAELLYQEANRVGLALDDEELREEYARRVARADSEEAYLAGAREHFLTKSEVLEGIRRELSVNRYVREEIASKVEASREEMRDFYSRNPSRFATEKSVRLGSIFVAVPEGSSDAQRASALTRISEALARVKAGEGFENVAREVSEDGVARRGGVMGWVRRGVLPDELEEAAFSMKPGEVSNIIETESGFHLLRIYSVRGGEVPPFEDVEEEVRRRLLERKKNERLRAVVGALRERAEITRQLD